MKKRIHSVFYLILYLAIIVVLFYRHELLPFFENNETADKSITVIILFICLRGVFVNAYAVIGYFIKRERKGHCYEGYKVDLSSVIDLVGQCDIIEFERCSVVHKNIFAKCINSSLKYANTL